MEVLGASIYNKEEQTTEPTPSAEEEFSSELPLLASVGRQVEHCAKLLNKRPQSQFQ